ncbi:hypothetical protein EV182_004910, partial [Spiromyces aspiralis]
KLGVAEQGAADGPYDGQGVAARVPKFDAGGPSCASCSQFFRKLMWSTAAIAAPPLVVFAICVAFAYY